MAHKVLDSFGQSFAVDTTAFIVGLAGLGGKLKNVSGSRVYYQLGAETVVASESATAGKGWLDQDDEVALPPSATVMALKTAGGDCWLTFEESAAVIAALALELPLVAALPNPIPGKALLVAKTDGKLYVSINGADFGELASVEA